MINSDGDPAFPIFTSEKVFVEGMSIRDYFAAAAMSFKYGPSGLTARPKDIARWSYELADAMLEERSKSLVDLSQQEGEINGR